MRTMRRLPLRMTGRCGYALATLVAVVLWQGCSIACATNPATGQRQFNLMSEAQELQIGQESDLQVRKEMGVYEDPELQRYVESVGMRMASSSQRPNLPWHFTVVDSPAVNAFALPGGYIYITRGILVYLNDESQMAGVLGHEIGHVTARHAAQQYSKATAAQLGLGLGAIFSPAARAAGGLAQGGLGLLFLKHGRDDELQADRLGAEYEAKNGWDPEGVQNMLRTLARIEEQSDRRGTPNYLLTHPTSADRVQKIEETVATLRAAPRGAAEAESSKTNRTEYLRRIDGLVYGDNPRDGIVRGDELLHPDLRFAIRFPSGWTVDNSKDQVVAKAPNTQAYMLLALVQQPSGTSIQDLALNDMRRAGFQAVQGGETDINGLRAFVGTFQGSLQNLGAITLRVGYVPIDRNIFRIVGLAPPQVFDQVDRDFTSSVRSFRQLSRAEAESIRPNRVDLYTVRAGDTWASIAEGAGHNLLPAAKLALINGASIEERPRPGDRIKIIVAT
jgi:predicted Zn-dependent protease